MPCPIVSKIRKIIPRAKWVTHLPIISKRHFTLASVSSTKVSDDRSSITLREPIRTPIQMTSETKIGLAGEVTQQDTLVRAVETSNTESEATTGQNEKNTTLRDENIVGLNMVDQVLFSNSSLESLPAELRRHLISMMELDSLQSLLHASPVYYRQYLAERRRLLSQSLESTLGSVTVDAYAVHLSNSADFARARNAEWVEEFLKSYHILRSKDWSSPLHKMLSMEDIISMVKFHCQIVQPLVRNFATQASNKLREHTESFHIHEGLSRTEQIRMMRAFYRYQLCCNIYGCGHGKSFPFDKESCLDKISRSSQFHCLKANHSSPDRVLKDFFCIFEPWEVEEIVCVSKFSQEKYEEIFDEIRWDVDEENPKFDGQRPPTPEGAFDLRRFSPDRETYLTSLTSRGLDLLHTVRFRIKDHEQLVSTMSRCMIRCLGNFLHDSGSPFDEFRQWDRHCDEPGERDHKQGHHEALIFQGDKQPNHDGMFPPLAWTLVWDGTYSNIFGEYIPEKFQEWGWVMWDAARLERTGAKELLMRQWEDSYDDDPREEFWYEDWSPR